MSGPNYSGGAKGSGGASGSGGANVSSYDTGRRACWMCGWSDHTVNVCPNVTRTDLADFLCYNCNQKGHVASKCTVSCCLCGAKGRMIHHGDQCPEAECINCTGNHTSIMCPKWRKRGGSAS